MDKKMSSGIDIRQFYKKKDKEQQILMFRAKERAVPLVAKRETTTFYCCTLSCSDGDNISGYELSVTCRVSFCVLDLGLGWSDAFVMGNKYCRYVEEKPISEHSSHYKNLSLKPLPQILQ